MNIHSRTFPKRQRGIIVAMAAVILVAAVLYVLNQTYGIIGTTSVSNQVQGESIQAFFLAESGIQVGRKLLASNPTSSTVCSTKIPAASANLGGGSFSLTGTPTKAGAACAGDDCDTCTIESTGVVGAASRVIRVAFSVTQPSGGAAGCGGGGATSPTCPCPVGFTCNASDIYSSIKQSITVNETPVVLFSAMAFARHPLGPTNNVDGNTCISQPGGTECITQWDVESNSSSGADVVGSRGSAVYLTPTPPIAYELTQSLTNDSVFAAIAAKIGTSGTLNIVGSYWDDQTNKPGERTVNGSGNTDGLTNNGAACETALDTIPCPKPYELPKIPTYSTRQTSKNWCYGADTLMFGFSGASSKNNSGSLTSFRFGTSPQSTAVPTPGSTIPGAVSYPEPVGTDPSFLYASLRYIYNPFYISDASASSGGVATAKAGIHYANFRASLVTGSNALTVDDNNGERLYVGDKIYCVSSTGSGCSNNQPVGIVAGVPGGGSYSAALGTGYTLVANSPVTITDKALRVESNVMQVSTFLSTTDWLSIGDTLSIPTTNPAPLGNVGQSISVAQLGSVPASGCTAGPSVSHTCKASPADYRFAAGNFYTFTSRNVTANGYTIHVASGANVPLPGTIVEVRNASRKIGPSLACVAATNTDDPSTTTNPNPAPERSASVFYLNDYNDTNDPATSTCTNNRLTNVTGNLNGTAVRLINEQICGGICAFFDHVSDWTSFNVTIPGTSQWAAGLTCMSGVDTSKIEGLAGTKPSTTQTNWHEVVR